MLSPFDIVVLLPLTVPDEGGCGLDTQLSTFCGSQVVTKVFKNGEPNANAISDPGCGVVNDCAVSHPSRVGKSLGVVPTRLTLLSTLENGTGPDGVKTPIWNSPPVTYNSAMLAAFT